MASSGGHFRNIKAQTNYNQQGVDSSNFKNHSYFLANELIIKLSTMKTILTTTTPDH